MPFRYPSVVQVFCRFVFRVSLNGRLVTLPVSYRYAGVHYFLNKNGGGRQACPKLQINQMNLTSRFPPVNFRFEQLPDTGATVRGVEYDMEAFLASCVKR